MSVFRKRGSDGPARRTKKRTPFVIRQRELNRRALVAQRKRIPPSLRD